MLMGTRHERLFYTPLQTLYAQGKKLACLPRRTFSVVIPGKFDQSTQRVKFYQLSSEH
jgi:hypothetical protein